MLSSYCDVFAQCQQLTGQTVLTSSVSFTAAGSEIWVFFSALHSVFAGASVRDPFVQGLEAITNRRCFESIEVSVFMLCCMPVYFDFFELLISVFFIIVAKAEMIGFPCRLIRILTSRCLASSCSLRTTSQMLWCPSNSRRWLLYTSDSVMHSIASVSFKLMTLCFVVLFLHADAEWQF
jgi:hypothetical protein